MRGRVKVTVTYEIESDTKYYQGEQYHIINPNDSPEMQLIKGVQYDVQEDMSEVPFEEMCLTGSMKIESMEFLTWL